MRCRKMRINLYLSGCIVQYPSAGRHFTALQYSEVKLMQLHEKRTFFAEKTFMKNQCQRKECKSLK